MLTQEQAEVFLGLRQNPLTERTVTDESRTAALNKLRPAERVEILISLILAHPTIPEEDYHDEVAA